MDTYILIDFDMILPMQSSEYTKSLNFESNENKKIQRISFFQYIILLIKNTFYIKNRVVSDRSDPAFFRKVMIKKKLKLYNVEKRIVSKLYKISVTNLNSRN